jgi:hypothetical protein
MRGYHEQIYHVLEEYLQKKTSRETKQFPIQYWSSNLINTVIIMLDFTLRCSVYSIMKID